ncbi:MAG: DUF1858 domain-containing protein [Burkholderiales bacterium]
MAPERTRAAITPATKVADLLESWPELEEVLIAQAPAFRRLRNPVLRRTVARVATLEQEASTPPEWLDSGRVTSSVDADALLDAGDVPLGRVNQQARALAAGELLRIDSSFRPVPLVEALAKQGYRCFVRERVAGRFETFVAAGPQ